MKPSLAMALLLTGTLWGCAQSKKGTSGNETAVKPSAPATSESGQAVGIGGGGSDEGHAGHAHADPSADGNSGEPGLMVSASSPEAIEMEIEEQIRSSPKNVTFRMQASEFYMNRGQHRKAIVHLKAATTLRDDALPWVALGDAQMLLGNFKESQSAYDQVAKREPDSVRYLHGQAQLLVAQEQFQKAGVLLERALAKHPEDLDIRAALGNLYLVVNKPLRAVQTLEPAVKQAPGRADLHLLLGDAHERNLHLNAAIASLQEAVRVEPRMSEAWGKLGQNLVNVTRYQEAREPLLKAISIEPMNSYYYWALGDSYVFDRSNPKHEGKGMRLYEQALRLDAKNPKALYAYAMALTRKGSKADLTKAAGLFERMLALKSEDMNVHFKLYEIYRSLNKSDASRKHLADYKVLFAKGQKQTKDLYAEASFLDTALVHVELAKKALAKGNKDLARKEFEFALERDPQLAAARDGLRELGGASDSQGDTR
ncbi:MAG: tetratricopeptide repeat protein [Armatimonadaceae bacterium]